MNAQMKYGWNPDLPDQRDHAFAIAKPVPLPPVIDLRLQMPPVYNQGELGSCTANAIAAVLDFGRQHQGKPFMSPSRLFVYFNERTMERTVSEDSGAQIRDGIKSVHKQGVCPESEWPYIVTKFADMPTAKCYADALKFQALLYSRVAPSLNSMLQCLASGLPFVFGFTVYESFESEEVAKTGIIPMPGLKEQTVGGHAVAAVGYDLSKRMALVRNSWGTDWGIGGYFWMPFDYISNPDLADDRWVIKLVEV